MTFSLSSKSKEKGPQRVYEKVSDKTINLYTSSVLPKLPSSNPLYEALIAKNFALSKKSNDKLGTHIKKSNMLIWILVLAVVMVIAVVVILMLGNGGGPNAAGGGGGLPGPLGSISKLGENFNIPNLGGNR